jgi:hypothetical protein
MPELGRFMAQYGPLVAWLARFVASVYGRGEPKSSHCQNLKRHGFQILNRS